MSPPTFADAGLSEPALALVGDRALLGVSEYGGISSDLAFSWLEPGASGFGDRAQVLPILGPAQSVPTVAQIDGGHLLVWQDWRGAGRYGISSRHVSAAGEVEGTAPQSIAEIGARPAVSRSGEQVLVWLR